MDLLSHEDGFESFTLAKGRVPGSVIAECRLCNGQEDQQML